MPKWGFKSVSKTPIKYFSRNEPQKNSQQKDPTIFFFSINSHSGIIYSLLFTQVRQKDQESISHNSYRILNPSRYKKETTKNRKSLSSFGSSEVFKDNTLYSRQENGKDIMSQAAPASSLREKQKRLKSLERKIDFLEDVRSLLPWVLFLINGGCMTFLEYLLKYVVCQSILFC